MTGIYIHVPFCAKKCPYCAFFSEQYGRKTVDNYVKAVIRNLQLYQVNDTVDTIYFGGGTPSLLTAGQISDILEACSKYLHLYQPEITFEFNPTGKRNTYLHDIHSAGVNRLSIGTQSFSDSQLKLLGRTHSVNDGIRTVETAFQVGFNNISCDLMLALPEQSELILHETLETLVKLPITHVSAYLLQIEEGTPFSQNQDLLARCLDDDQSADRYLQTVHFLEDAGIHQYEVSSFAKKGFESRHNLKYWKCVDYLGIGAGAHSCYMGKRFYVPEDVSQFCDGEHQTEIILSENPYDREERIMLGLRTVEGVPAEWVKSQKIPLFQKAGYLRIGENGNISLTAEGFAVSNAVISAMI